MPHTHIKGGFLRQVISEHLIPVRVLWLQQSSVSCESVYEALSKCEVTEYLKLERNSFNFLPSPLPCWFCIQVHRVDSSVEVDEALTTSPAIAQNYRNFQKCLTGPSLAKLQIMFFFCSLRICPYVVVALGLSISVSLV